MYKGNLVLLLQLRMQLMSLSLWLRMLLVWWTRSSNMFRMLPFKRLSRIAQFFFSKTQFIVSVYGHYLSLKASHLPRNCVTVDFRLLAIFVNLFGRFHVVISHDSFEYACQWEDIACKVINSYYMLLSNANN